MRLLREAGAVYIPKPTSQRHDDMQQMNRFDNDEIREIDEQAINAPQYGITLDDPIDLPEEFPPQQGIVN
jgi:hypothetical protein